MMDAPQVRVARSMVRLARSLRTLGGQHARFGQLWGSLLRRASGECDMWNIVDICIGRDSPRRHDLQIIRHWHDVLLTMVVAIRF